MLNKKSNKVKCNFLSKNFDKGPRPPVQFASVVLMQAVRLDLFLFTEVNKSPKD